MEVHDAAQAILDVIDARMADLVRKVTVERGLDPRDYVLFSYGGAASIHAGAFSPELGVQKIVVPSTASVHGAFGIVTSDVTHEYPVTKHVPVPAAAAEVNDIFTGLEAKALEEMKQEGFAENEVRFQRTAGLRFRLQMHEVITPVPLGKLSTQDLEAVYRQFTEIYEQKHGKGSAYQEAGMEIISFHLRAVGKLPKPTLRTFDKAGPDPGKALINRRQVFFNGERRETGVYRYDLLDHGNAVDGPAVIVTPVTTIVLQPGQKAVLDMYKNVIIPLKE